MDIANHDVLRFIAKAREITWNSAVGRQPLSVCPQIYATTQVQNWEDAFAHMRSADSEKFRYESRNDLYNATEARPLSNTSKKKAAQDFNKFIAFVRDDNSDIYDLIIRSIPTEITDEIRNAIRWNILMCCVSLQFRDFIGDNHIYIFIGKLYLAGHFFCGWKGIYPDGEIVVY